ncbi:riboflavin-binding protein-like [Oscarella lobularis]|uniref:riboflavin-binding protein-like n=1 Tax=Oscarella lobularis TaxID=121494 RepID=UPI00331339C6
MRDVTGFRGKKLIDVYLTIDYPLYLDQENFLDTGCCTRPGPLHCFTSAYDARLLAALCVSLVVVALAAKYNPTKCLEGENHKEAPSPEGDDYKACLAYRDRTCCTAKFTEHLAQATASITSTGIDAVRSRNRAKCSPNVNNWANPDYPSAMKFVPVCGSFCDQWYSACRKDLSCATDWISDWNYSEVSGNQCRDDAQCLSFETRYADGKALCEKMWDSHFAMSTIQYRMMSV